MAFLNQSSTHLSPNIPHTRTVYRTVGLKSMWLCTWTCRWCYQFHNAILYWIRNNSVYFIWIWSILPNKLSKVLGTKENIRRKTFEVSDRPLNCGSLSPFLGRETMAFPSEIRRTVHFSMQIFAQRNNESNKMFANVRAFIDEFDRIEWKINIETLCWQNLLNPRIVYIHSSFICKNYQIQLKKSDQI